MTTTPTMAADLHLSFETLFPRAPQAQLELRPDPRRGADLRLYTGAEAPAFLDLHLTRSLATLFLILLDARENDPPTSRFLGWRSRQAILESYGAIHSTIAPDGVPRNVRLINHSFRQALRAAGVQADGAQLISTNGAYKLSIPKLVRIGALEHVDLADAGAVKAALLLD